MNKTPQEDTLIEHQAVAHRPQESPPTSTVQVKEEKEMLEIENSKVEVIKKPKEIPSMQAENSKLSSADEKKPAEVIKKLVDDWDDDEEDVDKVESKAEISSGDDVNDVPEEKENNSSDVNRVTENTRPSVDKSEEVDEDQIVADVDDILNDTDNIINDVDSILSGKSFKRKHETISDKSFLNDTSKLEEDDSIIKTLVDKKRPTVQCEECYECFEDQEKLAWHALND